MSTSGPSDEHRAATARVGFAIFLGAWTMFFAAILFIYGMLRIRAGTPGGTVLLGTSSRSTVDLAGALELFATLLLAAATATTWKVRLAPRKRLTAASLLALGAICAEGGAMFFGTQQGAHETRVLHDFWRIMVVFFGGHVLVGVTACGRIAWRDLGSTLAAELWGWYWRFLGATWLAMLAIRYL